MYIYFRWSTLFADGKENDEETFKPLRSQPSGISDRDVKLDPVFFTQDFHFSGLELQLRNALSSTHDRHTWRLVT